MATTTAKLGLHKPAGPDRVNVSTDISQNLDILDNSVPDYRTINGKALNDNIILTADDLGLTSILNEKASQASVDALTTAVNGKANQSALDTLSNTVNQKASAEALENEIDRAGAAETALGARIDALNDYVDANANFDILIVSELP